MTTERPASVSPATDEERAIATITMAFSNDPVVRWVLRDAHPYLTFWPPFVRAFAGAAFARGTAHTVGGYGGVAMWLPPGVGLDDEAMGTVLSDAVPVADQDEIFAFLNLMDEFHPRDDHWYLALMGTDVTSQNRGYGSALLGHALERCDDEHTPAYLEATAPRNKALYERHGFEEIGVIQAGSSPPMWPMLRTPR